MEKKSQITPGNEYTFQDRKCTWPYPVQVLGFAENSHTVVRVISTEHLKRKHIAEQPEFTTHICHLTSQVVKAIPKEKSFTNFIQ